MDIKQYNQDMFSLIYEKGNQQPAKQYNLSIVDFLYPSKDHGGIFKDFDTLAFQACEIWHHKHRAEEKLIELASKVYPIIDKIAKNIRFPPKEGFVIWKESVSTENQEATKNAFDFVKTPPTRSSYMACASKIKLAMDAINRVCSCNAVSTSGLDIIYSASARYPDTLNIDTCKCLSLKDSCLLLISILEDDIGSCPSDLAYNAHSLASSCVETYRTHAFWANFDQLAKLFHKMKMYGLVNEGCGIINRLVIL